MDFCSEYKYLNDNEHILKDISYDDLDDLLNNFGSGLVLIGGSFSENVQAVIKEVNTFVNLGL